MKKQRLIALSLSAILAFSLTACGGKQSQQKAPEEKKETQTSAQSTEKPKEIHIAYQNSSIPILLAKAKGLYEEEFKKDGIEVKYDLYLSGPPMIEAFSGGRADFAHTGDMPPVNARSTGVDIKVIGRAGYTPAGNALLVKPDAAYKSVSELKGKKVAVQVGSSAHHFLISLLQKNGLKSSDINLVNLPASDHQNALANNSVEAVVTWEPWTSILENAKAGKVLADSSSGGVKRYIGVFLARNEFAKKYPDIAERFLKVNEKAAQLLKNNQDEALTLISEESKIAKESLARLVKSSDWDTKITPEDITALQNVKDFLKETNVLKKDYDINELFDDTYYKRLKK